MTMFNPKTQYTVIPKNYPIRDFHDYPEEYVVRPPYQRKNVWSRKKQQDLLDSMFRRFYVPRLVIREVRLSQAQTVHEVIDGQQRITTVQRFLADELTLPQSLNDIHPNLVGVRYSKLPVEIRRFVDRDLKFDADLITDIDDPRNPEHQKVATEIFWRLQQGESLNYMEVAHSKLSSLARNFVVKFADDQRFDYRSYKPIESNPDKHSFFSVIARSNERMQQLALLTRFLILEENNGPADIRDVDITAYIEEYERPDGIGNWDMEKSPHAKTVLSNMSTFYKIFKDDPMLNENNGMRELSVEYFIISTFLLLRHLSKYYVFQEAERRLFYDFVIYFYNRWRGQNRETDTDILSFSDHRQQNASDIEARDRIIRQAFFEYAMLEKDHEMLAKDSRRSFNEAERIFVYRQDQGLCQMCLAEGKPEKEAQVSWSEYQTDHVIPHSKGGATDVENAQVLCRPHNASKGGEIK